MAYSQDTHKKLVAAQALILEPLTSRQTFSQIRTLIEGVHPKIDQHLSSLDKHLSTWDKVVEGDVITLSAERLPENTEEEKARKKWLLFFINSWKQLGAEVERVRVEMVAAEQSGTTTEKVSHGGRLLRYAKGPFGLITVVAIGVVLLQQTSVGITVENKGCPTLYPSGGLPISIPGLKLPSEPIVSGGSANVTLPGFPVSADGTNIGSLAIKVLTYSLSFQLPSNIADVSLNGTSLLGKQTDIRLSERDVHTLVLRCK